MINSNQKLLNNYKLIISKHENRKGDYKINYKIDNRKGNDEIINIKKMNKIANGFNENTRKSDKKCIEIMKQDQYFSDSDLIKLRNIYNSKISNIKNEVKSYSSINIKKGDIIGEGAFGKVYQGFDEETGQIVALKEIDLKKLSIKGLESKLSIFDQEIKILSKLNHRNIVKYIRTIKSKENTLQIILEYCIGGSIAKLLEVYKTFSEPVIKKYTKQILEGLEFLHYNNIIHRDIKGANILVDRDGICKLSDFGGSKIIVEELEFQLQNSFKGTPNWMAPEIIKNQQHTRYSDIWSLGCTIIEMFTGEPPWSEFNNHMAALYHILNTNTPPKIPENASEELKDFLLKCLKMNPKERPNVTSLLKHPFITNDNLKTQILLNSNKRGSIKNIIQPNSIYLSSTVNIRNNSINQIKIDNDEELEYKDKPKELEEDDQKDKKKEVKIEKDKEINNLKNKFGKINIVSLLKENVTSINQLSLKIPHHTIQEEFNQQLENKTKNEEITNPSERRFIFPS